MMEVHNLSVSYEGQRAAEKVSFTLEAGQWLMMVGPNGAGKTTLVKAVAGMIPYEGEVLWEGQNARSFSSERWAKHVGVLSQIHGLDYDFTVEEIVELGRYAYRKGFLRKGDTEGEERLKEALEKTDLLGLRKRSVLTLSGGQWQRVMLAKAFAQNPSVLVLDEPLNHLDLVYQKQLFDLIGEWLSGGERAVISVVHDLSLARKYGTHALLLDDGQCAGVGTVDEILTPQRLEAVYHMDVAKWMREMLEQWK